MLLQDGSSNLEIDVLEFPYDTLSSSLFMWGIDPEREVFNQIITGALFCNSLQERPDGDLAPTQTLFCLVRFTLLCAFFGRMGVVSFFYDCIVIEY